MIKISLSVLASDLSRLSHEAAACERAGADMLHLDVMDGHFVDNITFGAPVIAALRNKTRLLFDVHLMLEHPEKYYRSFIAAGADILTFHLEAAENPAELIGEIRALGAVPSVSIKPETPVESVFPFLDRLGMVLIMTVSPGFGGQAFLPDTLPKIRALSDECRRRNLDVLIEVDGGINIETAKAVINEGANVLVAGSYIFKAADKKAAIDALRSNG